MKRSAPAAPAARSAALAALLATPLTISAQENPVILEGLVVTASPTPRSADAVASHVTVLEGAELRARGLKRVDEALREVPGVAVAQNGPLGSVTSLFMRGGESDYVLVLVDGVQVNQPGGGFDFSGLSLANVESIEVVRGPASALFGSDAVAGVIHIITRAGAGRPEATASMRAGSRGRMDWSVGVAGGTARGGYSVSVDHVSTDGSLPFNNAHANTGLAGTFRFRPDESTSARLSVRITDREYHFPTDGSGRIEDRNAFTFADETVASLGLTRSLSDKLNVDLLLGYAGSDGGTDDAPDGPADTLGFYGFTSLDHVRRATFDLRANATHAGSVVTAGVEIEDEQQRSFTESLSAWGSSAGKSEYGRWNRAYYAHATGERGPFSYNVGGRLEQNERFGTLTTWQAGAVSRLPGAQATRLRLSVGQGIKEPTFYENYATGFAVGNPDLSPERATSWEAGLDQTLLDGRILLRGTYFDQSFTDLIQYAAAAPVPGGPNFVNLAAADARGWEIGGEAKVGNWDLSASGTWLTTEVTDAGVEEGPGAAFVAGEPLMRRPAHTVTLSTGYALRSGGRLSVVARRVGAREDRDFSTWPATPVRLPAYLHVDVGGEFRLVEPGGARPGVSLTLRGENLLDEAYEEVFGFRAPGRGVFVGGRIDLGGGL